MSKHTSIRWYYGDLDLSLQVDTADVLSPEGIETIVHRTGREFTHRYRELDAGADLEDTTDVDTLAALEADES